MNYLQKIVVEIIKEPYQKINNEECCWEQVVKFDCYGSQLFFIKEEIIKFTHISHALKIGDIRHC